MWRITRDFVDGVGKNSAIGMGEGKVPPLFPGDTTWIGKEALQAADLVPGDCPVMFRLRNPQGKTLYEGESTCIGDDPYSPLRWGAERGATEIQYRHPETGEWK